MYTHKHAHTHIHTDMDTDMDTYRELAGRSTHGNGRGNHFKSR